jgi:hypothetical protein
MFDDAADNTNPRIGPPASGSGPGADSGPSRPVSLSPEQWGAVGEIKSFLSDSTRQVFSLHGLAGTGKSTLLARIARTPLNPIVAAPTGKAAAVLREKFDVSARTIHSIFHRLKSQTQRADGGRDLEFSLRRQDGSLAGKVSLIDESSMVTTELVEQLLRTGVRIIAFGDPGQLPPVKGEPGFPRADFMLRTIHRQAAGSPIIRQAHAVRAGGDYAPDGDAFQVVTKGNFDHLRQADVILCFRNTTRRYLNQLIRQAVGVDGLPRRRVTDDTFDPAREFPRRGDRVVVLKNAPRHDLWNGDTVKLAEVRAAFPVMQAGRHPHLYYRGLLGLHSRYGPSDCSAAQGGLCHEASIQPVAQPNRSSATRAIDNSLGGTSLHW